MALGYGVNGSGITGHSGVTGHDALVAVEMVRRRGTPGRQGRLEERWGRKVRNAWLWLHFHSGLLKYPGSLGLILQHFMGCLNLTFKVALVEPESCHSSGLPCLEGDQRTGWGSQIFS